jgi:dipeptidyl aminopeptidase/acylaminoacyl peptidase
VNEENELRIRPLDRDTVHVVAFGEQPRYAATSRWLAYSIDVSPSEKRRLEKENEPVWQSAGILDLATGEESVFPNVESFTFSKDGRYLAMLGYPPDEPEGAAADLVLRDLGAGSTLRFGDVSEFAWSDTAPLLAMIVTTPDSVGNGVQVFDAASSSLRVLQSSKSVYRRVAWREDEDDIAVLRAQDDSAHEDDTHLVLAWRDVRSGQPQPHVFDPMTAENFAPDMRVAEHRTPEWSDDGTVVFVGLRPWIPTDTTTEMQDSTAAEPDEEDEERSDVQIWHAKDVRIIPMQRAQERQDLERTLLSAWHLESGRFIQLGSKLRETTDVLEGGRYATETVTEPYEFETMFGRRFHDVYLIDVRTGERTKVLERIRHFYGGSATGHHLLYFRGDDFWTYDVTSGDHANRTEGIPTALANQEYDYPVEQLPPYGRAGWTTEDTSLLVYDKYDVWSVPVTGGEPIRLTRGAEEEIVHRYVRLDPEEDAIDLAGPIYFRISGEWTKRSGYARLRIDRQPERLLYEDKYIARLTRADSAAVFVYAVEDFDESPDYFAAGANLKGRRVTETNPFQKDFAWGRSELVDYESTTGRRLQAALYYPANYDPSRQYPMIVYQYELLSNRVHRYEVPSERDYYNFTAFSSQGYFVLLPDIVYEAREPGRSAVAAVVPAVQAVLDRGLVDRDRIGLVGHSWGGYQAAYIPTQTDIFAASVAGAPLTNFLSFMGAIHWNPGYPETSHWETGQARMEVPFWEDFEAHVRNSPAAFVHQLKTPMLMAFGDDDGVVDWRQGVEFYNYARRAGNEEFVLLVYPGEDHGLRKKPNQIDYHRRILQWFGHYLKGEPAAGWIKEGVSHLDRKRELEQDKGK